MKVSRIAFWFVLLGCIALVSCGSGSGSGNVVSKGTTGGSGGGTAVQVRVGDTAADSIISFQVTISQIAFSPVNGNPVNALAAPVTVELSHLSGTSLPVGTANLQQGSYSSATVTLTNPQVTIVNATGQPTTLIASLSATSVSVPFTPALNVTGATPVVNFDLNLAQGVIITGNNALITPAFTATVGSTAAGTGQNLAENGAFEDMRALVTAVGGSSVTVTTPTGQALTFNTNSTTQFAGISGVTALSPNTLVKIAGITQGDGTLLATRIEAEIENEISGAVKAQGLIEGMVTQVTGVPATQFQMVIREAAVVTGTAPQLGTLIPVNITSATVFSIDRSGEFIGLPFTPVFDANTIFKGQNVEVETEILPGTSISARRVRLTPQTVSGTVSSFAGTGTGSSTFTLNVPPDSAFALQTGTTLISAFQQNTTLVSGITVADGTSLRLRGLLFRTGTTYQFVASRITPP